MNFDFATITKVAKTLHERSIFSHLTIEPGTFELSTYGAIRAAHQDGFRAQEVH